MTVIIRDNNHTPKVTEELKQLDGHKLEIGLFGEDDDFMVMIGRVHEYGMTIHPREKQWLIIPLPIANGRSATEFDNLHFVMKENGTARLVDEKGVPYFVLVKKVTIPERSFIRGSFDQNQQKWAEKFEFLLDQILTEQATTQDLLEALGIEASGDTQQFLTDLSDPPNKPITIANKGSDNPLVDDGHLRQAITWKVRNA
jgi:hypothetical protein